MASVYFKKKEYNTYIVIDSYNAGEAVYKATPFSHYEDDPFTIYGDILRREWEQVNAEEVPV